MAQVPDTPVPGTDIGALICAPEDIFNTNKVFEELQAMAGTTPDSVVLRKLVSDHLNTLNQTARALIAEQYRATPRRTREVTRSYTYLTDCLVQSALFVATTFLHPSPTASESDHLGLLAIGGYGRGEMAPFSDVDLLFLTPNTLSPWTESVVESMLYILWDLRLKVGHSVRTIDDCIRLGREDLTIRTSLLESRFLGGDINLAIDLESQLWKQLFKGTGPEFVEQKLEERAERHRRQGQIRYLVEPNVKEGKGGLRDLQTLFWITKYLSGAKSPHEMIEQGFFTQSEYDSFAEAEEFLWTVRCHLHLAVNRAAEQLTFDNQVAIARALGYRDQEGLRAVEAFMQDYFRHATHVGDLTRIFLTALESRHVKPQPSFGSRMLRAIPWRRHDDSAPHGYKIVQGRLAIASEKKFLSDPLNFLRVFQAGLESQILLHPDTMRLIVANLHMIDDAMRTNPQAHEIFLSLLLDYGNPERALRRMNELGVLAAFIPEFGRIVALMQFNMYHHYTVDEHTIQCIANLALIEHGKLKEDLPIASGILEKGVNRRVLYVALLLHDIGKGLPEDHSIAGARLAETIAPQLGLDPAETKNVVWLVRNHLLMSDVAQKRDLSDPVTIREFAKQLKSTTKLNLLTVLTVCDIRGVGPGTWNNWKAQLLRDLYRSTKIALQEGIEKIGTLHSQDEAIAALRKVLPKWSRKEFNAMVDRQYPAYWQGLDTKTHKIFANLMRKADESSIQMDIKPDIDRDATRACFVLQDHPGIFSRLAGALALVGANVVDARTYTGTDGFSSFVFWIQDMDGHPYEKSRLTRLRAMIRKTMAGDVVARDALKSRDKIKKRERDFVVPTEITFDNSGSDLYTIIEVDTRDRAGLLYDLTKTLSNASIYVASAVIATYGEQAVDVFYVKDMFGLKLHSKTKQAKIKKMLDEAIKRGAEGALE